jgi:phosphonate transport system ATP-binding protein
MIHPKTVIQLSHVDVIIKSKKLLHDINLSIYEGELVTVVGPNGAGKSTLLKILTKIYSTSSGQLQVLNHAVHQKMKRFEIRELRSQVGQVFQGLHLVPRLTVLENVLIGRLSKNHSFKTWARVFNSDDHRAAREAIDLVGIGDKKNERIDHLSGGEKQKVAIARALAQESKLILADEPTSNLDPQAALDIANLLVQLNIEKKITVVSVVHQLPLLKVLGGRVVGLKNAKIEFDSLVSRLNLSEIENIYHAEKL